MTTSPILDGPVPSTTTDALTADHAAWDRAALRLGGHLLQSWRWGEFKSRHGWTAHRVAVEESGAKSLAQLLFRKRGPVSLAYLPRGPVFADGDAAGVRRLFQDVDVACRQRCAVHLLVETDRPLPFAGSSKAEGFVRGGGHFQPGRTVKIPLLSDQELLAQMHQKTRYSVRLAERRGVVFEQRAADDASIDQFYRLLLDTSDRNGFGIHSRDYYADFLRTFRDDALLLFASVAGEPAAALIAARFGAEAIYMYGASSTEHRGHGAAFALQFEAMRWARERGSATYDLWGIPMEDPESPAVEADRVAGTKGDDWRGLYKFKIGFGGTIVEYPSTLERRYHPVLSFAARRLYANHGV